MNTSLSKFAKDNGLHKSAVYRRCQELNISTADGLSPDAVERLEHEFSVEIAQHKTTATQSVQAAQPVVDVGNHSITLASPTLPQSYSLESLRSGEAISFEDPLAVAAQFLQASDVILAGMNADIQQRRQKLQTTQQAKDAVAQRRQKLELEARLYQLQTQQIDEALSEETSELQEQLAELQRLGKPVAESSPQSA